MCTGCESGLRIYLMLLDVCDMFMWLCYTSFGKHLSDKIHLLSLSCFCQICHSTTAESLYYFKVFFHCSVNRRIWCYIFNAVRFMPYWNEANLMLPTLGEKYANNDVSTLKKRWKKIFQPFWNHRPKLKPLFTDNLALQNSIYIEVRFCHKMKKVIMTFILRFRLFCNFKKKVNCKI